MICANLKSWSGSCATLVGGPPSASCFGNFLACESRQERRGQTAMGPTAPNYIRAKGIVGQTIEIAIGRPKGAFLRVRRADRAVVSWAKPDLDRIPEFRFMVLHPSEKRSGRRRFLRFFGRRNGRGHHFVRIWRVKRFGMPIALSRVFKPCADTRSRAANVQR